MSQVGEAFVVVRPLVQDFRRQVAQQVSRGLGTATIPLPVSPEIPTGSKVTWEKLATGAAIPSVVPLPVQPTITPAARRAFGTEVGGLRGALLGLGGSTASRALGISALAGGVFLFGKAALGAVKSAATLEQELNVFQQVSGASAAQMALVRAEARRLGADLSLPAVSAGDAAATMTNLAKAGLSVDQVLSGTKGTLQLAAAAQLDFATASDLSANALNAFQLAGTDAVKVADLLSGAANAAQGDISDFGVGLSQVAAVAHQAGLSVTETVTFLTEFAKAGIAGSDAGTSFRVALLRLIAPTKEAKDIFAALGVNLEGFQSGQIRAPEFFQDLRDKLEPLDKATRNAALATIFGTDAIRVASIAVRDAGKHYDTLTGAVSRAGQAAEISGARTEGLSGSVQGLSSNVETLGSDLGTFVIPALTGISDAASSAVGDIDTVIVELEKLSKVKVGPISLGGPLIPGGRDIAKRVLGFSGADLARDIGGIFREGSKQAVIAPEVSPAGTDAFGLKAFLKNSLKDPSLEKAMSDAGGKVGTAFVHAAGTEITKHEHELIDAAKKLVTDAQASLRDVVSEGQQAVADTIKQGATAISSAALEAKQNLTSIGQTLSSQVTDILASGPLAQTIKALQDQLDRSRAGSQRASLRKDLRDANEALAAAQKQVAQPLTAEERAGAAKFLQPFQQKVADAKASLSEFDKQATIDTLTTRLQNQKTRIGHQINNVVAKFNAGLLSGGQANERLVAILQKNVGPMSKAGKAQGFAFQQAFVAQVNGIRAQINAIVGGPGTKKTGAEPTIIRPGEVAAAAAADVKAAQAQATKQTVAATTSVKDAITKLHKTETDAKAAVTGPKGTNDLLAEIARELKAPKSKPSSVVVTPKKPRTGKR